MATWLFNSSGKPVAFVVDDKVFVRGGPFLGYLDGNEIWHGRYKGEIVSGNRLLYKTGKGSVIRGRLGTPGRPGTPGIPGSIGSVRVSGYTDVDFEGDDA